jgi:uncharacterized protein
MILLRTFIAPSEIQGVGIFAAEAVKKGTLIWQLDERFDLLFSSAEMGSLDPAMQDFLERYAYPHLHRDGYYVLNTDNSRFMNHSEQPNTDFRIFESGYALSDITRGEEITCNYFEFWPSFAGFGPASALDLAIGAMQEAAFPQTLRTRP